LPDPCRLQMVLGSNPTGENKLLESELLRHLFTRCSPDVQVKSFWLYTYSLSLERDNLMKEMIDFTLPRLRHLHIQVPLPIPQTRASGLMDLLDRCGTLLWKLELNIGVIGDAGTKVGDAPTEYEPNGWASLKELTLYEWNDKANDKTFWSWLFKRCGEVENLEVREFWGTAEFLAQAMRTHMPKLNQCTLGISNQPSQMPEDAVATLLSGSCNGWKRVKLGSGAVFGGMAMNALEKHYSTLEALDLSGCGQSSDDFVQVLRSCTHLHSFANFGHYGRVDARAFIDLDPETGSLRPWKCEATLKELKVRIAGVPRSYMEHDSDPEKECPDPGFDLNGRLYDRLARLTHLETLHLGDKDPDDDLLDLEMSLESGLHKLAGLRSLKELSVGSSSTKVNVKEVRWMAKHWPKLRVIKGLHEDGDSWEAVEWLRKHHPQIEVLEEMY